MTPLSYPLTPRVDQVDSYHGTKVRDPYRWLEDEADPRRPPWIAAQNALTSEYLSHLSRRDELRWRFEELLRYPRYYYLTRRGSYLFYRMNDGLQNQLVVYAQHDARTTPDIVVNPLALAPDGTTRVTAVVPSQDTTYVAYGLSHDGSDWEEYRVRNLVTGEDLPDQLRWVKFSGIAWHQDGFYYSRYPTPADMTRTLSARNERHQVWYHRIGSPQSADTLVYDDPAQPFRTHLVYTTPAEVFAALYTRDPNAAAPGNALSIADLRVGGRRFVPIVTTYQDRFTVIDDADGYLLVLTTRDAPNSRLVRIDPDRPAEQHWEKVIPETEHRLESVRAVGGKLFAIYQAHGAHRVYVLDRSGQMENELPLPTIGLASVLEGEPQDTDAFWAFMSFTAPLTTYRYRIATRTSSLLQRPATPFKSDDYSTRQVFYPSHDGTQIPLFLVQRKDLPSGPHPVLLHGYGGSGVPVGPAFDPLVIALLERNVIYAVACLRGGGEYGALWHAAGVRERKQNTFDDCIAAAEWVQSQRYTIPAMCGVAGSSNGGLVVGAVMTQRPGLFRVALPDVGVLDMLRFHRFTLGATWTSEYGSSDDPAMLPLLLAYSPLHNLAAGVRYPATLVTTSEHDDRVVPSHSFKFIATLQERGARPHPYLIRIETHSGHGPVSLPKMLDERADVYAFFLAHVGHPLYTSLPLINASSTEEDVSGSVRTAVGEAMSQSMAAEAVLTTACGRATEHDDKGPYE